MDLLMRLVALFTFCLFLFSTIARASLNDLKCYTCNSFYQKCGNGADFDRSIQRPSYCYGSCVKMVVHPGDFVIRACTTFFSSPINYTLELDRQEIRNECYLASYHDPHTHSDRKAYACFCKNVHGCNAATTRSGDARLYRFSMIFSICLALAILFAF